MYLVFHAMLFSEIMDSLDTQIAQRDELTRAHVVNQGAPSWDGCFMTACGVFTAHRQEPTEKTTMTESLESKEEDRELADRNRRYGW
jgi:hypothetical protein